MYIIPAIELLVITIYNVYTVYCDSTKLDFILYKRKRRHRRSTGKTRRRDLYYIKI